MVAYKGVSCARCGHPLEGAYYDGCPACKKKGFNVNYETKYDCSGMKLPPISDKDEGIYRFKDFFSLPENAPHVSIGEGNTPLHRLDRIGKKLGLNNLYMKDESKNPTMSHKDRMCSLIISKALADKAPGVVISSTGNQGASTSAYCSVAGLPCVIFTTPNVSPSMKTWMQAFGAFVFVTPTMEDRGIIMEKLVQEMGYAPASGLIDPPIGSSCFAVDGYKTISFEVFEQLGGKAPDWFIIPISYGDTLYGISKGMHDLEDMGYISKLPKLVAAEVFHSCENNLSAGNEIPVEQPSKASIQTSIATGKVTFQTVRAVRECGGLASTSNDDEALAMQQELAQTEGVFAEVSSCASLVVLKKLVAEKKIALDEKVVVLITSTGIKTPDVTQLYVPEIPIIKPTIEDYKRAMAESYHHPL
ncbi:MAG: pyridoxal-phosphate dependent enzyme [Synergistes jonesii]|uniref:threonine synthase n=1 Tax=Synergistes jonesii TaxID=2754 RepID=UPI002A74A00A|nr:pyridoxal-phosphate dependent enzyme [Synergistes jonesii]MDY2983707.1 pyridoxal-phosphate dependent enzyme [Synergistes jonesii]